MRLTTVICSLLIFTSCQNESKAPVTKFTNDLSDQENQFEIPESFLVKPREYIINPSRDTSLVIGSGRTVLHIPQNCFVSQGGSIINTEVVLKFTEYTNSAEIAFSQIPMTYSQGDEKLYFNSSGMFNIVGQSNGKPVNINKGKSMTIDYELAVKNSDIDFYRLSTEKKWEIVSEIEPKNEDSLLYLKTKRTKEKNRSKAPIKPIKLNINDVRVISIVFDDKEIFPEFQHYQNVKFRVCDKSDYNPKDAKSKWYSIDLKKTKRENEYLVSFLGINGNNEKIEREYFVNPVFEGKDYDVAMSEYNQKFKLFQQKKIEQKEQLSIELKEQEAYERQLAEEMRIQAEKEKDFQLAVEKNGRSLTNGQDPGHTYPDIVKGLEIKGFGIYNCDQLYRLKNLKLLTPTYLDQLGNKIEYPGVLSLINMNVNAAYSFNPSRVTCDLDAQNVLLLFTEFGKLYLLDKGEFEKMELSSDGNVTFKMSEVTNQIKNTKDLAVHLGINL